ncbi:MAG TPA: ornithine racemase Orr [Clostridia bacterium]|nr:ornithine racemase Orr [Clostridia bacterium]HPQ46397.1 ornithine racemase Orr [Clostridia bacterium]HRX41344.1 ornithine racemase Orr [Clostridia bacterium]
MYPRVLIDLNKFRKNVEVVKDRMNRNGIEVYGVTKVFCAHPLLTQVYIDAGLAAVADSRIDNLKKLENVKAKKVLLRIPMQTEVADVIRYSDVSLNSEISTIRLLSEEAVRHGKVHQVILMIDLGDLREGFFDENELYLATEEALSLEGIEVIGIGTNLTCFGAVIPTLAHMERMIEIRNNLEARTGLKIGMISGGNSSSYYLLEEKRLPKEINNLRIGEIFVCGNETAYGTRVSGTYDDVFILEAEIIELKKKPSLPIGESGMDAFGNHPVYEDKGEMLRGIIAIGKQDADMSGLVPLDDHIEMIGRSSDHMILDLTKSSQVYRVGDIMRFKLKYAGILSVMTSEYVEKHFIK